MSQDLLDLSEVSLMITVQPWQFVVMSDNIAFAFVTIL